MRLFLTVLLTVFWVAPASAAEQINDFDVVIDVQQSGDIIVTETINVTAEGNQIRRGIFRDLPRYYERDGVKLPYRYEVRRVERNGVREPYDTEREDNALQIRIGDEDVFLEHGAHVYEIEYAVKNQVRYFANYDEVYWNATGTYWAFPIVEANAIVWLPGGADARSTVAYTGAQGATDQDYTYFRMGDAHVFSTTRPLAPREGLTVAVGFEKGIVDPPSAADRRAEWWARNASGVVLSAAAALMTFYYFFAFIRVGRDPAKGPVFPRYSPPEGYSPAAVHHIFHRQLSGHDALIATILNLAVNDRVEIDAKDKKKTRLTLLQNSPMIGAREEEAFVEGVFNRRESFLLGDKYDASFTSAYQKFKRDITKRYGKPYFRWNEGFLIFGIALTVLSLILAANLSVAWTIWHTGGVIALIALTAVFSYFLPAPTVRGQAVRTEIEGFRLYLKTAEQLQLNAATPGLEPPPMTVERYERFLPYAAALGVEEPWTRHFERLIPEEAKTYQPRWAHMQSGRHGSLHGLNKALMAGMATGVASALPQSSSSSGSGGGGFSGGGGGGGGGGGW